MLLDREVRDLADEAQRALRADHQMRQDVHRIAEVDPRIQAVASGVLDAELVADAVGERGVVARLPREFGQPLRQRGALGHEGGAAGRVAGIEHRAVGQHDTHPRQRVIAVLCRAAAHAAGVVGRDAADHGGVDRRRVGPDLAAVRREPPVGHRTDHAGPQRDGQRVGAELDLAPAVAWQHQHRVAERLARQAGACRAKGHRCVEPGAAFEQAPDFGLALGHHHQLRHQAVEAGVAAPGQPAQRVGDQSLGGDEGAELAMQLVVRASQRGLHVME